MPANVSPPPPPPTTTQQQAHRTHDNLLNPMCPVTSAALFCTYGHHERRMVGESAALTHTQGRASHPLTCCFLVFHRLRRFLWWPMLTESHCFAKIKQQMKQMNVCFCGLKKKKKKNHFLFGVTQVVNDGLLHFWHVKIKRGFCFHLLLDPLCFEHVFGGGIQSASDTMTVFLFITHFSIDTKDSSLRWDTCANRVLTPAQ